jgi:hypothetical protein
VSKKIKEVKLRWEEERRKNYPANNQSFVFTTTHIGQWLSKEESGEN